MEGVKGTLVFLYRTGKKEKKQRALDDIIALFCSRVLA